RRIDLPLHAPVHDGALYRTIFHPTNPSQPRPMGRPPARRRDERRRLLTQAAPRVSRFHKPHKTKKKGATTQTPPHQRRTTWATAPQNTSGGDLLSHTVTSAVPSALAGLTTGFGMGPGVSPPL